MNPLDGLDETDISRLEHFFDDEADDDCLDFIGAHGFLSALAVEPSPPPSAVWLPVLLGESAPPKDVPPLLERWLTCMCQQRYHDDPLVLPCALDPQDEALANWCSGFMEVVFWHEDLWHDNAEAELVELTLPMLTFSGLIDDPELLRLRRDRRISRQMAERIPDVISEIYLFFHPVKGDAA